MPETPYAKRPTLLVLASTYPRWRADHEPGFVHELARRLVDSFHVVAVVPSSPGALPHEFLDGVEVFRYRYAPRRLETLVNDGGIITNLRHHPLKIFLIPTFVLSQTWRTWCLMRTRQVDVIHAHWLLPQGLIAALLTKVASKRPPFLVTSHGADLFALRGKVMNALKRYVVRKASVVTVVSDAMRTELARIGADAENVEVQPMGVDLTCRFTPDPSVERSHHEILFVGRLVEKKGLRHLIDAMPLILASCPTSYLTVVGFGPEERDRFAQAERLGIAKVVRFRGAVSQAQLPNLYRRAAVFVAPFVQATSGDQEGLGLVLVEALGCRCPVVVSDLLATRGIGYDAPGFVRVEPGNPELLAAAVIRQLSSSNRESAVDVRSFDWDARASAYAARLDSLLDADNY